MVLVRLPFLSDPSSRCLVIQAVAKAEDVAAEISERSGVPVTDLRLYQSGRKLVGGQAVGDDVPVEAVLVLPGGKGGFGSMLRALGAQIEKTTNKEACRDLSGRRLRDINEEDRMKKYVAKKADREREAEEKKKAKLEKLRRLAKEENKHEFSDPKYAKEREDATERVHAAMEHAFKTAKEEPQPSTSGIKRKSEDVPKMGGASAAKKGLWIGADVNESDLESSSDEEDVEKSKKILPGKAVACST